jgi:hypothetical protein
MMAVPLPHLSVNLQELVDTLQPHAGQEEVSLPGESFDRLVEALATMSRQALAMERELGAFRLTEAGRVGRQAVEELATGQTAELIDDPQSKIMRPDFGRRT